MTTIALIGNPNCGKSTLFNALTGAHQRVGNWPGVTVERRTGGFHHGSDAVEVVDLPGTYALESPGAAIDEQIVQRYVAEERADILVNVIDASSLARGLYLTLELLERGRPLVVALNMMDVADKNGYHIDTFGLAKRLGCPVVPLIATRNDGIGALKDAILTRPTTEAAAAWVPLASRAASRESEADITETAAARISFASPEARYREIDRMLEGCLSITSVRHTLTERIDRVVLNRYLAFPIFLGVMYLMFLFAINIGSAFIDFFDLAGSALFVEVPRQLLAAAGIPEWIIVFVADGVGGGIQLVGTFIPVIACLFLALSFLEDSGYMGRVAFIVDRLLRALGLPGKSFVPLIVGFGCNVPAVMATRTLDNQPDRILTTIMAPYMSCGARLTVYALFAAAFFPSGGQNIVFGLYLIGIVVAVISAMVVRKHLIAVPAGSFLLELPAYHRPTFKGLLLQTWQRLRGFLVRAGKAIVLVVVILNTVNSFGVDGSIGNQDSEKSVLSAIGRTLTPIFHPMGIDEENWPATVGIFTGIFAKEVVVGTLDALYAPQTGAGEADLSALLGAAVASVPENLAGLGGAFADPLGLNLDTLGDAGATATLQEVELNTIAVMRALFHGELGAFSYLLFILLYMPCVATIGVIYKELGSFWAIFSTTWSLIMAYSVAVAVYQIGSLGSDTVAAIGWLTMALALAGAGFTLLIRWGRKRQRDQNLIPVLQVSE